MDLFVWNVKGFNGGEREKRGTNTYDERAFRNYGIIGNQSKGEKSKQSLVNV